MKFSLSWLKAHLETEASLDEITGLLNRIGLEVEGVEDRGAALAGFRIAHVVSAEQHPNADRLRALKVDAGDGTTQTLPLAAAEEVTQGGFFARLWTGFMSFFG